MRDTAALLEESGDDMSTSTTAASLAEEFDAELIATDICLAAEVDDAQAID